MRLQETEHKKAYDFLMSNRDSAYKDYIVARDKALDEGSGNTLLSLIFLTETYLECALWADIYWSKNVCDSRWVEHGASPHMSFIAKLTCPIVDYGQRWDLLQFRYDRYLVSKYTGRDSVGRGFTLKSKLKDVPETPLHLQIRRNALVDTTEQHGMPDLMLTFAPGLFTSPWPRWVQQAMGGTTCHMFSVSFSVYPGTYYWWSSSWIRSGSGLSARTTCS